MRRLCLLAAVLFAACGSDSTGPSNANVSGAWSFSMSNLTTSQFTCSFSGTMQLNQSGTTFTGTYNASNLTCNGTNLGASGGTVVNGTVSGSSVGFDFDTQDFHQAGTLSGGSMSGTATWRLVVSGVTYNLSGTWSATKQ